MLRVRFAPSPTGFLHIGSARTYIFNWLYARRNGGVMVLRIDDTDVERNTEASLQSIFEGLRWLELGWDEQYRQSERLDLHRKAAEQIFQRGMAYRDFAPVGHEEGERAREAGPWLFNAEMRNLSAAESDRRAAAGEKFALRFKVPRDTLKEISFRDGVYGDQTKQTADIEDFALLRSDGMPTYHLASCADDADLRISHIIRGQDHVSNTFKHILIFEALNATPPQFAHLPLLVAPDGTKLSKRRHGPVVSVTTYRDAGFLPHAFVNFLCLLGWSPKNDREALPREELTSLFSFEGIHRSNAVINFTEQEPFDAKSLWLNAQLLRTMPIQDLVPYVKPVIAQAGYSIPVGFDEQWLTTTIDLIRARYTTLRDFAERAKPYFTDEFAFDDEALKRLDKPGAREGLRELAERLSTASEFTEASVEAELRKLADERGEKAGLLINGARSALTGQAVGPSAFHLFTAVGRERAIARLRAV
jgi:glutamyl-tRNA synthetase